MDITKARSYINHSVELSWTDRNGDVVSETVHVFDVNFVPFYGPCLLTSHGDIRLDRVVEVELEVRKAA